MLSSCRMMISLRKGLRILSSGLLEDIKPFSRKAAVSYGLLCKQPVHQQFLLCTRNFCELAKKEELVPDSEKKIVQMKGLPFQATNNDIINFFKILNIVPEEIVIEKNRWDRPSGFASVKFKTQEETMLALKNHKSFIGNRYIELSLHSNSSGHFSGLTQRDLSLREPSSSNFASLDTLKTHHRVILKGLPYNATTEDIIEFFAPVDIRPSRVQMRFNRFNLPSGICECTFETHEEAVMALKRHKAYIGSRWIEVFLPESSGFFSSRARGSSSDILGSTNE